MWGELIFKQIPRDFLAKVSQTKREPHVRRKGERTLPSQPKYENSHKPREHPCRQMKSTNRARKQQILQLYVPFFFDPHHTQQCWWSGTKYLWENWSRKQLQELLICPGWGSPHTKHKVWWLTRWRSPLAGPSKGTRNHPYLLLAVKGDPATNALPQGQAAPPLLHSCGKADKKQSVPCGPCLGDREEEWNLLEGAVPACSGMRCFATSGTPWGPWSRNSPTVLTQNCPSHSGLAQGFLVLGWKAPPKSRVLPWSAGCGCLAPRLAQGWPSLQCSCPTKHSPVPPLRAPASLASCIPSEQSRGSWPAIKLCHLITHSQGKGTLPGLVWSCWLRHWQEWAVLKWGYSQTWAALVVKANTSWHQKPALRNSVSRQIDL